MISQKGLSYNTAPTHSRLGLRLPELDHIATSSQKGGQEHKYLACFSISAFPRSVTSENGATSML